MSYILLAKRDIMWKTAIETTFFELIYKKIAFMKVSLKEMKHWDKFMYSYINISVGAISSKKTLHLWHLFQAGWLPLFSMNNPFIFQIMGHFFTSKLAFQHVAEATFDQNGLEMCRKMNIELKTYMHKIKNGPEVFG